MRLLRYLRAEEAVKWPLPEAGNTRPAVGAYTVYLREHRGLSESTIYRHRKHVEDFLGRIDIGTETDLARIRIEHVDQHLVRAATRLSRQSIGALSSSLRCFLGYLHMRGHLDRDLSPHVVTPHIYPLETLPRSIPWPDVQRTIASVDRATLLGARDYAILLLIAHCGLRACDVAALCVQDLDWRHDVIHITRTKSRSREDVPLVPMVGEALIAYLRQRPSSQIQQVFLTIKAPVKPLASARISWRVGGYLRRAGVSEGKVGSHTLRHSLAVELQRQGRSLKEIGDVLGHTHPRSTQLYAKAHVELLRKATLDITRVLP